MIHIFYKFIKTSLQAYWFVAYSVIVSLCIYITFYMMYLPTAEHLKPIHFQYRSDCERDINDALCSFPKGSVLLHDETKDIRDGIRILTRGQKYEILLELEMPLSEKNQHLGMFLSEVTLVDEKNNIIRTSSRSAMLPYRSYPIRLLRNMLNVLPLVFGISVEKELLSISIFEDYQEISHRPAVSANVTLYVKHIQLYGASLRIKAVFTGIRYYMHQWPVTFSAVAFISILWFVVIFLLWRVISKTVGASQYQRYYNSNGDISEDSETESAVENLSGSKSMASAKNHLRKRRHRSEKRGIINNGISAPDEFNADVDIIESDIVSSSTSSVLRHDTSE